MRPFDSAWCTVVVQVGNPPLPPEDERWESVFPMVPCSVLFVAVIMPTMVVVANMKEYYVPGSAIEVYMPKCVCITQTGARGHWALSL